MLGDKVCAGDGLPLARALSRQPTRAFWIAAAILAVETGALSSPTHSGEDQTVRPVTFRLSPAYDRSEDGPKVFEMTDQGSDGFRKRLSMSSSRRNLEPFRKSAPFGTFQCDDRQYELHVGGIICEEESRKVVRYWCMPAAFPLETVIFEAHSVFDDSTLEKIDSALREFETPFDMSDSGEESGWGYWVTVAGGLPLIYLLAYGPWLRFWLSRELPPAVETAGQRLFRPALSIAEVPPYREYLQWWVKRAKPTL